MTTRSTETQRHSLVSCLDLKIYSTITTYPIPTTHPPLDRPFIQFATVPRLKNKTNLTISACRSLRSQMTGDFTYLN